MLFERRNWGRDGYLGTAGRKEILSLWGMGIQEGEESYVPLRSTGEHNGQSFPYGFLWCL